MLERVLSVRGRNLIDHVAIGACLLVTGVARAVGCDGALLVAARCVLVALGLFAMWARCSDLHEHMDEMAGYHSDRASATALVVVEVLLGIGYVLACVHGGVVGLEVACPVLLGIAMLTRGVTFAALEREDTYADYQDA